MRGDPFYYLLGAIIFAPLIIFSFYSKQQVLVLSFFSLVILGFILHLKDRKIFILNYAPFLFSIPYSVTHLTLEKIEQVLFFLSTSFIILLLNSEKKFRNYFYLSILSLLNLILVSINFQNFLYGIILTGYLYLLLYLFLLLAFREFGDFTRKVYIWLFKYSLVIFSGILLIGTLFFFIIPRPEQPLIAFLYKKAPPSIGYSGLIKLGAFSSIAEDNSVVFRAKLSKFGEDLYWRGNTLEIFRKGIWISYKGNYALYKPKESTLDTIREEILLNPYGGRSVFVYFYPIEIKESNKKVLIDRTRGIVKAKDIILEPLKVNLVATSDIKVSLKRKDILLEVPKNLKPLLRTIIAEYHLQSDYISAVLERLKEYFSTFTYSKTNKAKNLIEFLKIYKEGNCEYFATAAALLLRELGYPTRVVVGFIGGDYNPLTGFYVIRQKDAHAWVEIYSNHKWIRFDGTKYAIYTEKKNDKNFSLESKIVLWWDALNTLWLEYVINFDKDKQKSLWQKVLYQVKTLNLKNFKGIGLILLVGIGAIIFVFLILRKYPSLFISLYLLLKYRKKVSPSLQPIEVYIYLWKQYPQIWQKERKNLYKFYIKEGLK